MTVVKQWPLYELNIKNAFLYDDLHEKVYMTQPPGYETRREPLRAGQLKKAIYVLKQLPLDWFDKFNIVVA